MLPSPSKKVPVDVYLHPKQTIAYESLATEILFGGAAGGGKSHLMRCAAIRYCHAIPNLQVYLFRRLSDDLEKNHMEGPTGFPAMLAAWVEAKICRITYHPTKIRFWNNAVIHLSHCQYEKDTTKYQGAEMHLLLIDELTHFTDMIYRYLRGRNRLGGLVLPEQFKGLFPRIICGTNPSGIGHNWVKNTFVDSAAPFEITKQSKSEGGMLRQYIPSKLEDNPTMMINDPDYEDKLSGLGAAHLVKALRDGDWNIISGGAMDDVWTEKNILPQFVIPHNWRIDRAFDWGSAHPFAVGWFAEADGTEVIIKVNGQKDRVFCPPRGSLIQIAEWYGGKHITSSEGIKMGSRDIAKGVLERERELRDSERIQTRVNSGPADNQIDNVIDSSTPTIAKEMSDVGVDWTKSDKSAGSRKIGLDLMRQMIKSASNSTENVAGLWFMENCRSSIAQLPVLPRDLKNIEDVDTKAVDHVYDMIRYRVLSAQQTMAQQRISGI